jgi:5,10-methylenetetrahydrofolate reductase
MLLDALDRARDGGRIAIVCDVSPPRPSTAVDLAAIGRLRADALFCAYLPGRAVRLDAATMAALLRRDLGAETVYALATRDMNRLALSAHILSAAEMDVPNVVVLRGDSFSARDRRRVRAVYDTTPTQMIAIAAKLAEGRDFRGRELGREVPLCIGAAFNPNHDLIEEVELAVRKVEAGACFLLTEPISDATYPERFHDAYRRISGRNLDCTVCWGVAVLARQSVALSAVPQRWQDALAAGCPGTDLALDFLELLRGRGVGQAYLIPPIFAGGERDYSAAATVIEQMHGGPPAK